MNTFFEQLNNTNWRKMVFSPKKKNNTKNTFLLKKRKWLLRTLKIFNDKTFKKTQKSKF